MSSYPKNWKEIAKRIKDAAGWTCERCKHPHSVEGARVLTVHHLDGNKSNCADWNLAALCQRCHLRIQGRVKMDQMFFAEILDVSEWFKPHLEGYLQSKKRPAEAPKAEGVTPTCKCGNPCQLYGGVGGYSKACKECNEKNAARQRADRARRKQQQHDY